MDLSARMRGPGADGAPQGQEPARGQPPYFRVDLNFDGLAPNTSEVATRRLYPSHLQTTEELALQPSSIGQSSFEAVHQALGAACPIGTGSRQAVVGLSERAPLDDPAPITAATAVTSAKRGPAHGPDSQRSPELGAGRGLAARPTLATSRPLPVQIQDQGYQGRHLGVFNSGRDGLQAPQLTQVSLLELKHQNKHNLNEREKLYK